MSAGVFCHEFIGRAVELDFLLGRLERVRDHTGSTIVVTGTAGIGKTRLVAEAADRLRRSGVAVASVACWELGGAPFAPLIEIAEAIGIAQGVEVLRSSATIADAEISSEKLRRFASVAAAFAAHAAADPFVVIVEDLHWADRASLELLRYLAAALKEHPVGLVLTMRVEEDGDEPGTIRLLGALERGADATIGLRAMSDDEVRSLLHAATRENGRRVAAVTIEEIAELADGKPFHAEELLRGMLERSARTPAISRGSLVPRSLRASIRERLALLGESDRTTLAHAAVIGRRFNAAFLSELVAVPLATIFLTLRRARNLQIVDEDADGENFLFRHALTREVVYDEILFAEARGVHREIARRLAAAGDGADITAIAYHAWRSGDAAAAVVWNERAGDHAATVFAHVSAIRFYERAVNAAARSSERGKIAEKLARALYAIGDFDEALPWFERASLETTAAGDPAGAQRMALQQARALFENGRFEEGIRLAEHTTAAVAADDLALRHDAHTMTAGLLTALERPDQALAHLDAVAALAGAVAPRDHARYLGIRAHTLFGLNRINESSRIFAQATAAARETGDTELLVRTLNNHAALHLAVGETAAALAVFESAIEVAATLQSARLIAWLSANAAYAALAAGDIARASGHTRRADEIDHGVALVRIANAAAALRIATLTGTPRADIDGDALVDEAIALGNPDVIAEMTGAVAQARVMRGEPLGAAVARAPALLPDLDHAHWLLDAIARTGGPAAAQTRERLAVEATTGSFRRITAACLALFDARVALRERRRADAADLARAAAGGFRDCGMRLEEAYAWEAGGRVKDALERFGQLGAAAEVARLSAGIDKSVPRRRGEAGLTVREREIAALLATGSSNKAIAAALTLSERTVETHVAAIFAKLGVTNRRDAAAVIPPST